MKIALHSDLHLEGNSLPNNFLEDKDFDVLVLAGDIVNAKNVDKLKAIAPHANGKPVIYIPGNHEYYGGSLEATEASLRDMCKTLGWHYGDRFITRIDGVSFITATGWSDLSGFGQFNDKVKVDDVQYGIADFNVISEHTVADMILRGNKDKRFIRNALLALKEAYPSDKMVVVTHFAPTEAHGNPRFSPSPLSSYFSNDWADVFYEHSPDYWLYGHTHGNVESDVFHTKVLSNQRGYGRECQDTYNPNYIFEVQQ